MPQDDSSPLGELIRYYLNMLKMTQKDLADEMGLLDVSPLNRIIKGHTPRPHDSTLRTIAEAFQRRGLTGVSFEDFRDARDRPQQDDNNPFGIPSVWVRLVRAVLAHPEDVQDGLLSKWSLDLQITSNLLATRARPIDESDDYLSNSDNS